MATGGLQGVIVKIVRFDRSFFEEYDDSQAEAGID